jgi:glucose dehydrogenase
VDVRSGRPKVNPDYATSSHTSSERGPDINAKGICPAAIGAKGPAPAAFNPMNGKFYVPTTNLCMDYEPFRVEHTEGQPYVGATLNMFPADKNRGNLGGFLVWNATTGKIEQSKPEKMGVISGVLTTEGGIACYGTLDGYLKCVDANDISKELYRFKTPSGIIGNVNTWEYKGRQYIGVLSGIGGWAGIGLAAGLERDTDGLGAVGAFKDLAKHTDLGGVLTVFALP